MSTNFYILGMGRSGTTLFQNIVDAHSNIVAPLETFLIHHLFEKYKSVTNWNDETLAKFIEDVYTDRPFRLMWRIPRKSLEAAFQSFGAVTSLGEALNVVRASFRDSYLHKELLLFGDKKPTHSFFTKRLMQLYPKAKIIHMVRDPRGNANGHINTFNRRDALSVGMMWNFHNKAILQLQKKYPQQYFLLRYEDLVEETEATMQQVFEFLGVPYEASFLDYNDTTKKRYDAFTDTYRKKHKSLLKPIDKAIAYKWKTRLLPKHKKQIEYVTAPLAQKFGYSFSRPKPTLSILVLLPFARIKMLLKMAVIRTYFTLPFGIRKWVLTQRSKASDTKYWPEQPAS